jgi:DNA invertase Pin-like site-specific DNA recombinase
MLSQPPNGRRVIVDGYVRVSQVERAIQRVEQGESDGVVVAYLTRFGRSLSHGLNAIQRITDAGGRFVTVQEGEELDFSTDTGRLLLRFFLSLAEWELDRIRTNWAVASQRAIARGVYFGQRPFGYLRGPDGRLSIDPVKGPIAVEQRLLELAALKLAQL